MISTIIAQLDAWLRMSLPRMPRVTVVLRFASEREMRVTEAMIMNEFRHSARDPLKLSDGTVIPMVTTICGIPVELQCEEVSWRTVGEGRVWVRLEPEGK